MLKYLFYISWWISFVNSLSPVTLETNSSSITIQNGFTYLVYDISIQSITTLSADFNGNGKYGHNILSLPFKMEVVSADDDVLSNNRRAPIQFTYDVVSRSSDRVEVLLSGISNSDDNPIAEESWRLSLERGHRFVEIQISGSALRHAEVLSIRHGVYTGASSLYGLYDRGLVQMMNNTDMCFGSSESISRAYMLGNDMSLDVLISYPNETQGTKAFDTVFRSSTSQFSSAFEHVVIGSYPHKSLYMEEAWGKLCWEGALPVTLKMGESWSFTLRLGPNNMDFPVFPVPTYASQAQIPLTDLRTFLTGAYASGPGCLQSYYDMRQGTIAPTVAHPDIGYFPDTNFFDPDNFISLSAMLFSGDAYMHKQVKEVLERTANTMCGIGSDQVEAYCKGRSTRTRPRKMVSAHPSAASLDQRAGQLMHHFIDLVPTYESIAGSEQLGPNIFWSLCTLRYAAVTGDMDWLASMEPYIALSSHFLLSFFDEDMGLLLVPGPLWIDVLVRENYTSDSNAIAPFVLDKLADAFSALDTHCSSSLRCESNPERGRWVSELRRVASIIKGSMNLYLWEDSQDDHYVTQLNLDRTTTRDFIDYDANLLAVAFGVTPSSRVESVLQRVDSGPYTHVRGTWCSEVAYSGDADDCYIVGGDVCGDSVVTLARIGWADAHARKRVGDLDTFNTLLLEPLQEDLITYTWLYERYDSAGEQTRTPFYFEYPSLVTMMLFEVRYGIYIDVDAVRVNPFPAQDFTFAFGSNYVQYSQNYVELRFSGSGVLKVFYIHSLQPNSLYSVNNDGCMDRTQNVRTDADGTLQFEMHLYSDCSIKINAE